MWCEWCIVCIFRTDRRAAGLPDSEGALEAELARTKEAIERAEAQEREVAQALEQVRMRVAAHMCAWILYLKCGRALQSQSHTEEAADDMHLMSEKVRRRPCHSCRVYHAHH